MLQMTMCNDPQVLDDPEVKCFPVAELKDAEEVFNTEIMNYEPEVGEQRQLTIIGDYGSEIDKGNLGLRTAASAAAGERDCL